jgi:hypothetical protein
MKNLCLIAAGVLFSAAGFADQNTPIPLVHTINWSLLTSGSWEENKTLYNRGEFKLNFNQHGLILRGEILDRRPLNFGLDSPFGDPDKRVTNYLGALYHTTGSRILYGVLDEWGLSARIRNPWIRSPAYSENHKPLIADLKTSASVTKNDEVYLYLSSPVLNISPNVKIRGFISGQSETDEIKPAFAGGVDFKFPNKTGLLVETFFTGATLPPTKNTSWFTNPPPLPEREFKLYAAGLLFHNQLLSASSDLALSKTFFWGTGIYGNFGISITPLLPFGSRARPLAVSFTADRAGEKFIYRDGLNHGEGFRNAAKIEWKGKRNSLLRFNTMIRSPELGENFSRSSSGFYYRTPSKKKGDIDFFPVRLTRISFSADRNADNLQKIDDRFSGNLGLSLNLGNFFLNTPIGINISGSIRGLSESTSRISPYPIPDESWILDNIGVNCEFIWSPSKFQLKSKTGFTYNVKNNENLWDFSFSTAVRFKKGRLSIKTAAPNFPEKWNLTISWRLEAGK